MTLIDLAERARTWLFVPGDRPDRFSRAAESGADVVIIDLEDAVGPTAKDRARRHAAAWHARTTCAIRINAPSTPWHVDDVRALGDSGAVLVMIPMADDPATLAAVAHALPPGSAVVALIESAMGVRRVFDIAHSPGVSRLAFGNVDLAAELRVDPDDATALMLARQSIVMASRAAGLQGPIDGVTTDTADPSRVLADVKAGAALGFGGKLCIHPRQVSPARAGFVPSDQELAWARRVIEAAGSGRDGVFAVDGHMIDAPVIARANALLAAERLH
jgi:citrate lyase subunit beta/citryl-CoA lyase